VIRAIIITDFYNVISFQSYRINSTISIEKKKNAIPPPIIPIQAAICLVLDIVSDFSNVLLNLVEFP